MVAELCYEEVVEEEEETVVPFEANIDLTNLTINEAVAAAAASRGRQSITWHGIE